MTRLTLFPILYCALLGGLALPAPAQQTSAQPTERPYRINDDFAREEVKTETIAFAPDGQAVALVRLRPANSQIVNSLVIEETRADIWLQDEPGRPVRNVTNGQADSSGWWSPQWSPDGQRLAMLSSRGGTVTLWAWERTTNVVRRLSPAGVDFNRGAVYHWVDTRRLLAVGLPEGEVATPMGDMGYTPGKYAELTMNGWAKAMRGEVTASVIHSLEFKQRQRRLFLIDVTSSTTQPIADTQLQDGTDCWWLSPDGRAVAVRRPVPAKYPLVQRAAVLSSPASLDIRWIDGRPVRLDRPLPENIAATTVRWSPDGKSLAFFAWGDAPIHPLLLYFEGASDVMVSPEARAAPLLKNPARLWRVDLEEGRVTPWDVGDLDLDPRPEIVAAWVSPDRRQPGSRRNPLAFPEFDWIPAGGLLFHAARRVRARDQRGAETGEYPAQRTEWVVLAPDGRTRPGAQRLKPGFAAESLEVAARRRFEETVRPPSPSATLVAFSSTGQSAIYAENNRRGTFLWRVAASGQPELLMAANTFLRRVAFGEAKLIEYTTLNGEQMKAYLLLPPGYTPGRRYPLVVDSDIGYESDVAERRYARVKSGGMPTGRGEGAGGYMYMFTSMPTRNTLDAVGRANLLLLTHGILPAVDQAILLGYADPDRLFLFGWSSMGYGVYGLVTQTRRFKAAVAGAGWTDQITSALLTGAVARYAEWRFDGVSQGAPYSGFFLPFWRNADHLRRNSPLSYVDRVQTPLMIIHGDLDIIPISTAEMFFAALIQQRKPAQFVRYWGEGHVIQNPRNYADSYQRMFAWFDEWGDISRDAQGNMVFENGRVKSRGGQPALKPADYARFDAFQPGGEHANAERGQAQPPNDDRPH